MENSVRRQRTFGGGRWDLYRKLLDREDLRQKLRLPDIQPDGPEANFARYVHRLTSILDGEDETLSAELHRDICTHHAHRNLDRLWLDFMRRLDGGTDAAVLIYLSLAMGAVHLRNIHCNQHEATFGITNIGPDFVVEVSINDLGFDNAGELSFSQPLPAATQAAMIGKNMSTLVEAPLFACFDFPILTCNECSIMGMSAMIDLPRDQIKLGDLSFDAYTAIPEMA